MNDATSSRVRVWRRADDAPSGPDSRLSVARWITFTGTDGNPTAPCVCGVTADGPHAGVP